MIIKDWNYERHRTRDRLLYYTIDMLAPTNPSPSELPYPYQKNINLPVLKQSIYAIAVNCGYKGTEDNFWSHFGSESIIFDTIEDFPLPGDTNHLYFDQQTSILYYFKETKNEIDSTNAQAIGAIIIETESNVKYMYIPVQALPIENILYSN